MHQVPAKIRNMEQQVTVNVKLAACLVGLKAVQILLHQQTNTTAPAQSTLAHSVAMLEDAIEQLEAEQKNEPL